MVYVKVGSVWRERVCSKKENRNGPRQVPIPVSCFPSAPSGERSPVRTVCLTFPDCLPIRRENQISGDDRAATTSICIGSPEARNGPDFQNFRVYDRRLFVRLLHLSSSSVGSSIRHSAWCPELYCETRTCHPDFENPASVTPCGHGAADVQKGLVRLLPQARLNVRGRVELHGAAGFAFGGARTENGVSSCIVVL